MSKNESSGTNISGYRFVGELFEYTLNLRDASSFSLVVDADQRIEFFAKFSVEIRDVLATALGVSRDALPELSVLRRLP